MRPNNPFIPLTFSLLINWRCRSYSMKGSLSDISFALFSPFKSFLRQRYLACSKQPRPIKVFDNVHNLWRWFQVRIEKLNHRYATYYFQPRRGFYRCKQNIWDPSDFANPANAAPEIVGQVDAVAVGQMNKGALGTPTIHCSGYKRCRQV